MWRSAQLLAVVLICPTPALAHEGWGIVRDAYGRIYVSDIPANTIWRLDPTGQIVAVVRDVHSHALVVGFDGAIYGTHVHLTQPIRSVWRIDLSGRLTAVVPPTRGFPLDLQPFLLGPDGTLYSRSLHQADRAPDARQVFLLRRTPAGAVDTLAGGPIGHRDGEGRSARFTTIDGMAWLADGTMVVADGTRLRRVTLGGDVETMDSELSTRRWEEDLLGVAVAPDGSVHAADFSGRRTHRIDPSGRRSTTEAGMYWSPTGVLPTDQGTYLLEHPRAPLGILGDLGLGPYLRIRLVRRDSSSVVLATVWGRHTALAVGIMIALGASVGLVAWNRA